MEYGEALTAEAHDRALSLARRLCKDRPLAIAAAAAVDSSYCVCVTDGEDAAEGRLSDLHQRLIQDIAAEIAATESVAPGAQAPPATERDR